MLSHLFENIPHKFCSMGSIFMINYDEKNYLFNFENFRKIWHYSTDLSTKVHNKKQIIYQVLTFSIHLLFISMEWNQP